MTLPFVDFGVLSVARVSHHHFNPSAPPSSSFLAAPPSPLFS